MDTSSSTRAAGDRTWLVALAASLWGTSSLMRDPLKAEYPAATIVFFEHLVLVLCLAPWLVGAVRALLAASPRVKAAVLVIGAGSSALATTLFTAAFAYGDPVTPQVLQKLQPLFAMLLAAVLLGERLARRFAWFAVPALAGAWLLAFADPFAVSISSAVAAVLALGAALLWGAGTVLGRLAGSELSPVHLTTLRFAVGLPATALIAAAQGVPLALSPVTGRNVVLLLVLALVPGLLALTLYYRGLSRTPASRATLAELAFPVTAAAVGVGVLDAHLTWSQWLGFVLVLAAITALSLHERSAERPAVRVPEPVGTSASV
ncbi:DMT family transporter [Thermasporomyces composti]|jgi:drug/metabolite transporter (DMT)-like permease|uniref:EamA-like transporter family protein n=1 Tax=Thermasporomyces composti TaxID=696763 RepID=A0A3D9V630_THECX|nr:DMT family transporter [Thermasporomyces composti]REF36153.1 EamA-like transporter family protein [Thermasporomyces composti]